MMFQGVNHLRPSIYHGMLIVAVIVIIQDLGGGRGVQAWMYNYSTEQPGRDWDTARRWCQDHFTDMVAIQNRGEIDYLNKMLPYRSGYYWIGIRKVNDVWTWVGTKKTLTPEAENWATGEPNNLGKNAQNTDCVEFYIKRDKEPTKWNDERCSKKKGTICYTASCSEPSCGVHAECMETIGSFTCQCHPGFLGPPRCEDAIACKALLAPEQGSVDCVHPYGPHRFNSSCQFYCDLGYRLVGLPILSCQATGQWDHPAPLCQVAQCADQITAPSGGIMNCSHPIAPNSYNSTCEFGCDDGYELNGQNQIRCDSTGQWTASVPTCTAVRCPRLSPPSMGNMTCVDPLKPFSFSSSCHFTCEEGYSLMGNSTLNCLASGQWSKQTPVCTVIRCSSLKAPPHASMQCQDPLGEFSYGSTCTTQCEEGFNLIGANSTQCFSRGNWSHALPLCQVKRCSHQMSPPHGSLSCSDLHGQFSFGSRCNLTCEEGFLVNGTAETECSSMGIWTREVPPCLARPCPLLAISPLHGWMNCSHPYSPFSHGSHCDFGCIEGFLLRGTPTIHCNTSALWSQESPSCQAVRCPRLSSPSMGNMTCVDPLKPFSFNSSCHFTCEEGYSLMGNNTLNCLASGQWSKQTPVCTVIRCSSLKAPPHASMQCQGPLGEFSYGSTCTTQCEEGFDLIGDNSTQCFSQGDWSHALPLCQARPCPLLAIGPLHGWMNCSHPYSPFSHGSHCDFGCIEGFLLRGTPTIHCNTSALWSQESPSCQAVRCPRLSSPSMGNMTCFDPVKPSSFNSSCHFTCEEGHSLMGNSTLNCLASGQWSKQTPVCTVIRCSSLKAPPHASMQCQDPLEEFSYGSTCTTQCEEGFDLIGDNFTQCFSQGDWSHALPLCQARPCPLLAIGPLHGWMNCSHPYSPFSHGSHCDFGCIKGFLLRGTPTIHCNTSALWSQESPSCQAVRCPRLSSPSMGNMTCVDPLKPSSFNSSCHFTCEEGHSLMGNSTLNCLASGQWSKQTPVCTVIRCSSLKAPPHASMQCQDPLGVFSYGSKCTTQCEEGFDLIGVNSTQCFSQGNWSHALPLCQARPCPLLAIGPHHGWMNCSHPYSPFSHGSHCDFGCIEGFLLRGTPTIHCNTSALWSQESPSCQVVLCEALPTQSSPLFMNCSHPPLGNFSFGSQCLFTCDDGFAMNGTDVLSCSSTGRWIDTVPTCTEEGIPLGAAMLMYTGIGAGSAVAVLALIGLGLLIAKHFTNKKKGIMDFEPSLWEETVNPAFES